MEKPMNNNSDSSELRTPKQYTAGASGEPDPATTTTEDGVESYENSEVTYEYEPVKSEQIISDKPETDVTLEVVEPTTEGAAVEPERASDQPKLVDKTTDSNEVEKEVKAATRQFEQATVNEPKKPSKWVKLGAGVAAIGALVGGVAFTANKTSDNHGQVTSTSAEANPGNSNEQESSQNVLAGITVDKTLKEFDNKEYKNVMSLLEAKNYVYNPLDTPAANFAVQFDPNHAPIADYNAKIFGILLNGSSDEIKDLLQQLGLGPTELKEQYDKSIKLGTFNEWGDIEINTPSKKPWPSTQGSYTDTIDLLSYSIMYNRIWAVSIANAIEVTGGDIPPVKPRDAETLKRNNELITNSAGPVEDNLIGVDTKGDITVDPETGKMVIPENNTITTYDDLMIIYIDPDDPNLELQISKTMPSVDKASNPAYWSLTSLPGSLSLFTKYPYQGPTIAFYLIPKQYL